MQTAIDSGSVFDSNEARTSRESHAKERDLGNKIMAFAEVRWASVEHDEGERYGLGRTRPQSASVFVIPEGTGALSRARIMAIQELVRSSYAGMEVDDVSVIDTNSTSTSALTDDLDPLLRQQKEVEVRVEHKVRSLLVGYPGARVAVAAEIDPQMDVEKTTVKYDAEPTNLTNRTRKVTASSNRQPDRGVPGTTPNAIGNRAVNLEDSLESTQSSEDERETSGVAGQQYENSRMASLQVKSVRVSVALPLSYYETLHSKEYLKQNPEKTVADVTPLLPSRLEELRTQTEKAIQTGVSLLLPKVAAGADPLPMVTVWDFPDMPTPEPPAPDTAKLALAWLGRLLANDCHDRFGFGRAPRRAFGHQGVGRQRPARVSRRLRVGSPIASGRSGSRG